MSEITTQRVVEDSKFLLSNFGQWFLKEKQSETKMPLKVLVICLPSKNK